MSAPKITVTYLILIASLILQLSCCIRAHEASSSSSSSANSLSRGFGDGIKWVSLLDAFKPAWEEKKPIFLLIHKSWCGACQNLKPQLKNSLKFQELSENFIMVNVEDDEEPQDEKYAPDGGYIPRLLFLDSNGEVHTDITNRHGNPKFKYYYMDDRQVMDSMKQMMERMETMNKTANKKTVVAQEL